MPGPTLRLYRDWCNYSDDDDDVYDQFDFEALVEYVRVIYPFPRSLSHMIKNIEKIYMRYQENPSPVYQKLSAAFRQHDDIATIINENIINVNARIENHQQLHQLHMMDYFHRR
eukprot:106727_1